MLRIRHVLLALAIIWNTTAYGALRRVILLHGRANAKVELVAPKGYQLQQHRGPDFDTYNLEGPLGADEAAGLYVGNAPSQFWERETTRPATSTFDTVIAGMKVSATCWHKTGGGDMCEALLPLKGEGAILHLWGSASSAARARELYKLISAGVHRGGG